MDYPMISFCASYEQVNGLVIGVFFKCLVTLCGFIIWKKIQINYLTKYIWKKKLCFLLASYKQTFE